MEEIWNNGNQWHLGDLAATKATFHDNSCCQSRTWRQLYGREGSARAAAREAAGIGALPPLPPLPKIGDDEIAAARAAVAAAVAASGMLDVYF